MSIKISSYLTYNVSLRKMAGKTESFLGKKLEYELVVKCLENLVTEKSAAIFHDNK